VEVALPDGSKVGLPISRSGRSRDSAWAAVKKDAGDDPDVTHGVLVEASVSWTDEEQIVIRAGEGVGTATKPGLAIPPGEPAINPVPRRMIRNSVRELTKRGMIVTISIPGGIELAAMTFNPRLGIEGGLSILGTSGVVRPFSASALREALECSLSVARACAVKFPVFVPGRIGFRAARELFRLADEQLIEVSNEWGFMLDLAADLDFDGLLVLGHPGKLAKLVDDQWDTHSKRSRSAVPTVARLARELLGRSIETTPTVEGLFAALPKDDRKAVADELASKIGDAVHDRVGRRFPVSVVLVNLKGEPLGRDGDLARWLE